MVVWHCPCKSRSPPGALSLKRLPHPGRRFALRRVPNFDWLSCPRTRKAALQREVDQCIYQSHAIRLRSVGKFDLITAAPEHLGQIQFAIQLARLGLRNRVADGGRLDACQLSQLGVMAEDA